MKKYKKVFAGKWKGENYVLTLKQWAQLTGKNYNTLHSRITKYGWTFDEAINLNVSFRKKNYFARKRKI